MAFGRVGMHARIEVRLSSGLIMCMSKRVLTLVLLSVPSGASARSSTYCYAQAIGALENTEDFPSSGLASRIVGLLGRAAATGQELRVGSYGS